MKADKFHISIVLVTIVFLILLSAPSALAANPEILDFLTTPLSQTTEGYVQFLTLRLSSDVCYSQVYQSGFERESMGIKEFSDGTSIREEKCIFSESGIYSVTICLQDQSHEKDLAFEYMVAVDTRSLQVIWSPVDASSSNSTKSSNSWPSYTMEGYSARTVDRSSKRIQSMTGPSPADKPYAGGGAYRNEAITSLTVFFYESGSGGNYVYAELTYEKGYLRRLYFKPNAISFTASLPTMDFEGVFGTLTRDVVPGFGPGYKYDNLRRGNEDVTLSSGQSVTVLCEENGFLFIDCESSIGSIRIWVPSDAVK